MNKTFAHTIYEIALIVFFLTLICAPPLVCILFSKKEWSDTEKRVLAASPKAPSDFKTLLQFPKDFEAYYNDHFGFREVLIDRYHREMRKRFGQTGVHNVVAGKDGWYFYTGDDLLNDFRGLVPLTDQQIISWKENLVGKRDWLAKRGIHYLFVVIPNKQTIYPEYLPDYFQKAKGTTRLEQLTQYLKKNSDVEILDLRPELFNAKSKGQLYAKTDTHWNDYGAFVGYRKMMHRISRWFPKEQFKFDFYYHYTMVDRPGGDLPKMLGLRETIKEVVPVLKERHFCAQPMELNLEIENFYKRKETTPFMKGCKDANLRALVFRDSFFNRLEPFFSENFQHVVYLWQFYDQEIVERLIDYFHPHIVIEERVERFCTMAVSTIDLPANRVNEIPLTDRLLKDPDIRKD
jgi:alginate O-acetyltransferase complex protein AlgJ